jgi:XTP/dITP diphosphohydrolase
LADLPPTPEPEETGHSFLENASIKAIAYARATNHLTLADDSGLEVDALHGAPGIHSAYFANRHGIQTPPDRAHRDPANNTLLLQLLQNPPPEQRTARFVCTLALANPKGEILLTSRGTFEGHIRTTPAGQNGFGYDPLFQPLGHNVSSAELSPEEKNRLSHRAKATALMVELLKQHPVLGRGA